MTVKVGSMSKNRELGRKRDDNPKDNTPSREEAAHTSERPSERIPMFRGQGQSRLGIYAKYIKKDYRGYFFAEGPRREGRIDRALSAWWEPVVDDQGNKITYKSGDDILHLMQLPEKYANEDRALKQKKIRSRLEAEAEISESEYSPNNEKLAVSSEESDRPL